MAKADGAFLKPLYDVHPGVAMVQKWIAELKEKTGRSLEEWVETVRSDGPKGETARRDWLKKKHKLGTNSAWWLAERAAGEAGKKILRSATSRPRSATSTSSM